MLNPLLWDVNSAVFAQIPLYTKFFIKFKVNSTGLDGHIVIASKGQTYMNIQHPSVLHLFLQIKRCSIVFKIAIIVQTAWGGGKVTTISRELLVALWQLYLVCVWKGGVNFTIFALYFLSLAKYHICAVSWMALNPILGGSNNFRLIFKWREYYYTQVSSPSTSLVHSGQCDTPTLCSCQRDVGEYLCMWSCACVCVCAGMCVYANVCQRQTASEFMVINHLMRTVLLAITRFLHYRKFWTCVCAHVKARAQVRSTNRTDGAASSWVGCEKRGENDGGG